MEIKDVAKSSKGLGKFTAASKQRCMGKLLKLWKLDAQSRTGAITYLSA